LHKVFIKNNKVIQEIQRIRKEKLKNLRVKDIIEQLK